MQSKSANEKTIMQGVCECVTRVWNYQFELDGDIFSVKECAYTFAGCLIGLAFVMGACWVIG